MNDLELYHYGVKGMKWGVRRYQNKDGSLTAKGVKRYATAGYAQDSYKSNKSVGGKIYDKVTGAHKIAAKVKYDTSSKTKNRERAERYLAEKEANKRMPVKEKVVRATANGAKATAKALTKIGAAYCYDQFLFHGAGTRAAKAVIKNVGRFAISAFVYAQGGRDIRWYDN